MVEFAQVLTGEPGLRRGFNWKLGWNSGLGSTKQVELRRVKPEGDTYKRINRPRAISCNRFFQQWTGIRRNNRYHPESEVVLGRHVRTIFCFRKSKRNSCLNDLGYKMVQRDLGEEQVE